MKMTCTLWWATLLFLSPGILAAEIVHLTATGLAAPLPIYTHATIYGNLVYVSGMQGFIPESLQLAGPDAESQATQALLNMKLVLEQAGSSLERVLKLNLFFIDLKNDFTPVNNVINKFFPQRPPARSSMGVQDLPKDARIVIDCVAAAQ